MHDLNFFRKNLEDMQRRLATRGYKLDIEAFQDLDKRRRQCVTESEQLKAARNQATAEIGKLAKRAWIPARNKLQCAPPTNVTLRLRSK